MKDPYFGFGTHGEAPVREIFVIAYECSGRIMNDAGNFCELCIEIKSGKKWEKQEVMHKKMKKTSFFFCYFALLYSVGI
ncbi:MAG: hypothetical protein IKV59_09220 [Lachnospiraceae bacterium]|nr:hypothetical protein [Lachnospiraceae bacterium]